MGDRKLDSCDAMAASPLAAHNSMDQPVTTANLQDQVSIVARDTLLRQAQEERQAQAIGQRKKSEPNHSQSNADFRTLPMPAAKRADTSNIGDDFETRVGKSFDPSALLSRQLFFQQRQELAFDRVADSVYSGFGRVEFKLLGQNLRLDYLNGRKCGIKRLGLCLSPAQF